MLSKALCTRQRTLICRLHIHHASTSPPEYDLHFKNRTALIRTLKPFHNLADTWTLLRAVERRYGKVVEAQFLKDYEVKNRYRAQTYVVFRDKESLRRIPKAGQKFDIPALVTDDRPGGLGLNDIEYLLDSTNRDETFEFPSSTSREIQDSKRIIKAQIVPTSKDFYTYPEGHRPSIPSAKMSLAKQFLTWGGFHKLELMELGEDIKEGVWLEKPPMRMRAALQWSSRFTGLADPGVIHKPTVQKEDGKVSDSSPDTASMDSPESSSPTTPDIPISDESTSKSTEPRTLLTELPQRLLELTQLSPNPTPPEITIPPPGQLTPKQPKKGTKKADV